MEFTDKTVLMDSEGIRRALTRTSHEIVEKNKGVETIVHPRRAHCGASGG